MACTLVAGSINMDVVNRVRVHPKPGETIHGLGLSYNPGGKGANQAVAAARAGVPVRMFGAVGDDASSATLLAHLGSEGIATQWIQRCSGPAGTAFITVDNHGENSIIVEGGANALLTGSMVTDAVVGGVLADVDTLLVQNEVPAEVTLQVMKAARADGVRVIFNPAPVAGVSLDWLADVDVVVVNETEAEVLTGVPFGTADAAVSSAELAISPAVAEAASVLLGAGAGAALLTLGGEGAVYATHAAAAADTVKGQPGQVVEVRGELLFIRQPVFKVQVVDTTAAGDTFVGSFAAARSLSGDLAWSLQYAAAASALAVTRPGAQASVPDRQEVLEFLAEHGVTVKNV